MCKLVWMQDKYQLKSAKVQTLHMEGAKGAKDQTCKFKDAKAVDEYIGTLS